MRNLSQEVLFCGDNLNKNPILKGHEWPLFTELTKIKLNKDKA